MTIHECSADPRGLSPRRSSRGDFIRYQIESLQLNTGLEVIIEIRTYLGKDGRNLGRFGLDHGSSLCGSHLEEGLVSVTCRKPHQKRLAFLDLRLRSSCNARSD
jgi:hypothetical protein